MEPKNRKMAIRKKTTQDNKPLTNQVRMLYKHKQYIYTGIDTVNVFSAIWPSACVTIVVITWKSPCISYFDFGICAFNAFDMQRPTEYSTAYFFLNKDRRRLFPNT